MNNNSMVEILIQTIKIFKILNKANNLSLQNKNNCDINMQLLTSKTKVNIIFNNTIQIKNLLTIYYFGSLICLIC
jgi:hypothetical protein